MEENTEFDFRIQEVCEWDKRKKCDSLYIEENIKLKKKLRKVLEKIEECSDEKVKNEIKKLLVEYEEKNYL